MYHITLLHSNKIYKKYIRLNRGRCFDIIGSMKSGVRIFLLLSVSVLTVAIIILFAASGSVRPRKTLGYTDKDDLTGIYVPEAENNGLFFDTTGFVTESGVCLFLPCTTDLTSLVLYTTGHDGEFLERFEHDFSTGDLIIDDVNVFALKSHLPSINISISRQHPGLSEIEASEDHSTSTRGIFELRDISGNSIRESASLQGRGNTSWTEDKKSYQVELGKGADLLSMGKATKWILLANAGDYSLLRNEVFLSLANDLGLQYTPELRQVDLFIDGEYRGAYSLCERVERGKTRVDIGKNDYLFRIGPETDSFSFFLYDDLTKKGEAEYYPIYGEVRDCFDRKVIEKESAYLKTAIDELYDPSSDLKHIDLDSLVRYYWLQEFSKTTDPSLRSVYLFRRSDENLMHFGPAWDYDRTAGIIEMPFREEDYQWPWGWTAREQDYYKRLFKNPVFTEAVDDAYKNGSIDEAFLKAYAELPSRIENIRESADMNFRRWSIPEEENNKVAEVYGDTSYESHLQWLTDWLKMRQEWIAEEYSPNKKD